MDAEVYVSGEPLEARGVVADPSWSEAIDGGCEQAAWQMPTLVRGSSSGLRRGLLVEVVLGGDPLWAGVMSECDFIGRRFAAVGLSRAAKFAAALNAAGTDTTTNPQIAVEAAMARGVLPFWRTGGGGAQFTSAPTSTAINYVADLLDASAEAAGQRWGVDRYRRFYQRADSTTPVWQLVPTQEVAATADDQWVTTVVGRRVSAVTGGQPSAWALVTATDTVAAAALGPRERIVDLTNRGLVMSTDAQAEVDGQLARDGGRTAYTEAVEASPFKLLNSGGTPADVRLVRPGDAVRVYGGDPGDGVAYEGFSTFVIGRMAWKAGVQTAQLTPVGFSARSFGAVFTEVVEDSKPSTFKTVKI